MLKVRRYKHGHHRRLKATVVKELDETPSKFAGKLCPTNLSEAKEQFLQDGTVPKFVFRGGKKPRKSDTFKNAEIRYSV